MKGLFNLVQSMAMTIFRTPASLRWVYWVLLFLYFLSPFDLFPDRAGGFLGRIDDILLAILFFWAFERAKKLQGLFAGTGRKAGSANGKQRNSRQHRDQTENAKSRKSHLDPHQTLGIQPGAAPREIKAAYRKMLATYHPDKFAHLGREFEEVARIRTQNIIEAYQRLIS